VSRYYGIDEANGLLPEVERILAALRDQRAELIGMRDRIEALGGHLHIFSTSSSSTTPAPRYPSPRSDREPKLWR